MGAPADVIEKAKETTPENTCLVDEENWETFLMFLRLQTQWVIGMAGAIGLNYQSVEYLFRLHEVKDQKGMLEDLQIIEKAVLRVKSESLKK